MKSQEVHPAARRDLIVDPGMPHSLWADAPEAFLVVFTI
jgi:hypothetical protein